MFKGEITFGGTVMNNGKMIAVVGMGAILPDASERGGSFWKNIKAAKYSITDIPADRWKEELVLRSGSICTG